MIIVVATAVAAVLWVTLWSLNAKAFDAFMLAMLIVVVAATVHIISRFLPGNKAPDDSYPDPAPFN